MVLVVASSYDQSVTVGLYLQAIEGMSLMERLPIRCRCQNMQKIVFVALV